MGYGDGLYGDDVVNGEVDFDFSVGASVGGKSDASVTGSIGPSVSNVGNSIAVVRRRKGMLAQMQSLTTLAEDLSEQHRQRHGKVTAAKVAATHFSTL